MSPLSRNPRDAAIQFHDIRRWGRCQGSLQGRPLVITSTGLRSTGGSLSQGFRSVQSCSALLIRGPGGPLHGCGLVRNRRPEHSLASCPRSRLRSCGLLRGRCLGQLLASCPRSRRPRGCGLVWSPGPGQLLASCPRTPQVFPTLSGSAKRCVDLHLPLIASISGRRL